MLVYRSSRTTLEPAAALAELETQVDRLLASDRTSHDAWTELLIDAGQIETAVADALAPEVDDATRATDALRELTVACARGERAAWYADDDTALGASLTRVSEAVRAVRRQHLPRSCSVGVPEGYAYYAVYPETYGEAARRFGRAAAPRRVTCVGIRTIGTSLSAVVAAELERAGCDVRSWTVRPRGHPFDRHVRLTPTLRDLIAGRRDGYALVIDEGPGLSGSSFTATADALAECGFPDERIVLFPSWAADGSALRNDRARARWRLFSRYVADFDDVWVATGRLERLAGAPVRDASGGRWRELLVPHTQHWPAVQPQHEQRKYLIRAEPDHPPAMLKFVGLGRYGRARFERARVLAAAGFAPGVHGLGGGFLGTGLVAGRPFAGGEATAPLADRAADYLAFVRHRFPVGRGGSFDELAEMIELNTREALGVMPAGASGLADWRAIVEENEVTAIDGRMLAHEWIRCDRGGFLKADGLSHHDDHFWPGCQDIAWDVAATIVELDLGAPAARAFVDRYRRRSGDTTIGVRLPFWRAAYLASRLGYVALAARALGASSDGRRMRALEHRYTSALRRSLILLHPPARETSALA